MGPAPGLDQVVDEFGARARGACQTLFPAQVSATSLRRADRGHFSDVGRQIGVYSFCKRIHSGTGIDAES